MAPWRFGIFLGRDWVWNLELWREGLEKGRKVLGVFLAGVKDASDFDDDSIRPYTLQNLSSYIFFKSELSI